MSAQLALSKSVHGFQQALQRVEPHRAALLHLLGWQERNFLGSAPGLAYAISEMFNEMAAAGYRLSSFTTRHDRNFYLQVADKSGEEMVEFQERWSEILLHTCESCGRIGEYVRPRRSDSPYSRLCPLCSAPGNAEKVIDLVGEQRKKLFTKMDDVPEMLHNYLDDWMRKTGRSYLTMRGGAKCIGAQDLSGFHEFLVLAMKPRQEDEE